MNRKIRAASPSAFILGGFAIAVITACGAQEAHEEHATPPLSSPSAPSASAAPSATLDASASVQAAHPAPRAPVVVSIVVDQMAAWLFSARVNELPASGGFHRLLREGTYVRDMRYMHAATDTAPGHSSLYTGKTPRESGIFANEVLRDGKTVSILRDESTLLVDEHGVTARVGSSIARLLVPTVADDLRAKFPDAYIVSLSLKDRGAIFGGGRTPNASYWHDVGGDEFVTSTAFDRKILEWAARDGGYQALVAARKNQWVPLDPAWVSAHAATPDDQPGEGDLDELRVTFPHRGGNAHAFRATPFADSRLIALAEDALSDPRAGQVPTLVAISFSAFDYIGHTFGPDSWESWDELERLDASLADFFGVLDADFGKDGWSVVLAADHGTFTMPEAAKIPATQPWCVSGGEDRWQRPCISGRRVMPSELTHSLEVAATKLLGEGPWISGVADPYYYLSDKAHSLPAPKRKALDARIEKTTREVAGSALAHVYSRSALEKMCGGAPPAAWDESENALLCNSFMKDAGDGYVMLTPGSFFDPGVVVGKGTSHGSPYPYDRSVPLLVRDAHAEPRYENVIVEDETRFTAFSSAIRALLGLTSQSADAAIRSEARVK